MSAKKAASIGLKITLKKSLSGRKDSHIATAVSLGLKRINDQTIQPDNAATQGKLKEICYLVTVEPAE